MTWLTKTHQQHIHSICAQYPQKKSALLPVLLYIQENISAPFEERHIEWVSNFFCISSAHVYDVLSFYSLLHTQKEGHYIVSVCTTPPCMLCGSENIMTTLQKELRINAGEVTENGLFSLKEVECLGRCVDGPIMTINNQYHTHITAQSCRKIIQSLRNTHAKDIS